VGALTGGLTATAPFGFADPDGLIYLAVSTDVRDEELGELF
jgi:hypothetical protein